MKSNKRFFYQGLILKSIVLLIAGLLMILNFSTNCFNGGRNAIVGGSPFHKFQYDSESLVLNKIYCDKNELDGGNYGLNGIDSNDESNIKYYPYKSQVGLQGFTASFLHNNLHLNIKAIKLLYVLSLAIILILICKELSKKFGKLLGFITYNVFLFSPWICAFARNLYWVEFTWFLPILFGLKLSNDYSKWKIYTPLIFLSVFIKCLCGYEYITVIMSVLALFLIYDLIFAKNKSTRIDILKKCALTCGVALLGFIIALLIHAGMRGNGHLLNGLKSIYIGDVERRTLTGSSGNQFDNDYIVESINANPFYVLRKYLQFNNSNVLGNYSFLKFEIILFITITALFIEIMISGIKSIKKWTLFILLFLTNASWFILASPHSYIHTHMNYVLWYFGFIQFEIYITITSIVKLIKEFIPKPKEINQKDVPNYEKIEINKKKNKYCLLIPVINEGNRILTELETAKKYNIHKEVDIIICDGDSTDGSVSKEKMRPLGVNTILIKKDTGKQGAQLRMGISFALERDYEGIITIDGNNKDSIEDVPKFIQKLEEGYDFIQGSRFVRGGKAINTPKLRYVSVRLLHAPIISLTAGEHFTDTTNAFRAYSKKYLTNTKVQPLRGIFQTYELLAYLSVRASQLDMRTCEIPVRREYPKNQKTPTKISFFKGNYNLFKILLLNMLGKYNPKEESNEKI